MSVCAQYVRGAKQPKIMNGKLFSETNLRVTKLLNVPDRTTSINPALKNIATG